MERGRAPNELARNHPTKKIINSKKQRADEKKKKNDAFNTKHHNKRAKSVIDVLSLVEDIKGGVILVF